MINRKFHNSKILTEIFLGRNIKVINSSDISKIGISGICINDTKNMFYIKFKTNNLISIKRIPKKECIFEIEINNDIQKIDGKDICYNLSDRLKKYA